MTVAAKRALGIGDTMLLERRAAQLADGCGIPLEALDLGLLQLGARRAGNRRAGRPAPSRPGAASERARWRSGHRPKPAAQLRPAQGFSVSCTPRPADGGSLDAPLSRPADLNPRSRRDVRRRGAGRSPPRASRAPAGPKPVKHKPPRGHGGDDRVAPNPSLAGQPVLLSGRVIGTRRAGRAVHAVAQAATRRPLPPRLPDPGGRHAGTTPCWCPARTSTRTLSGTPRPPG